MKKLLLLLVIAICVLENIKTENINKPISSQYGFIENKGQIIDQNNKPNPTVLYLYNGNGMRVQLRKEGFSYEVIQTVKIPKTIIEKDFHGKFATQADSFDIIYKVHRVDINFKDGNKNTNLKAYQPSTDFINYYTTGTSEEGVTNVQHFQKVIYENVYPNIDIEFVLNDAANRGKFKYNFIVKPNANLADIKLELLGANHTSLTKDGNILIETAYGNLEETIPLSYVINDNKTHTAIKANFTQLANNTYGINAENYNPNQTLVIDPTNWATYYGGSGEDYGYGITTDSNGNIIITGLTTSTITIATVGSHQTVYGGGSYDIYIVKFNSIGTRQWGTYCGGIGSDSGTGIRMDLNGNIVVTGITRSSNAIATTGSHQTVHGGNDDSFIAKFSANGIRLWATYYGGFNDDAGFGITIDLNNNILIVGYTFSTTLIATTGSHQSVFGGSADAFIVKFNASGTRLWATYYGGNNLDEAYGITTDLDRNIIITGTTPSTTAIATTSIHQTSNGGLNDAFIVKFDSSGARLWGTYYGGTGSDYGRAIITDLNGNILVTGYTQSSSSIATTASYQTSNGGGVDAFIAKFNPNGIRLWATYFGGAGDDNGYGITKDTNENIIIVGFTNSTNAIATTGSHQVIFNGGAYDAFIAKFNINGIRQFGTYYGGIGNEYGIAIATDGNSNITIMGHTTSATSIATIGSHQNIFGGGTYDAFVAKFGPSGTLPVKLISFDVQLQNYGVNCIWETATETNNDYFNIERSKDGSNFESIGKVKGQGNTNTTTHYSFIDEIPIKGVSYYRLKQTDFDNQFTYSKTVTISLNEYLYDCQIYPNPANDKLFIESNNLNHLNYNITDVSGKEISTGTFNNYIDISKLNEGMYIINLYDFEGLVSRKKFIKQQ